MEHIPSVAAVPPGSGYKWKTVNISRDGKIHQYHGNGICSSKGSRSVLEPAEQPAPLNLTIKIQCVSSTETLSRYITQSSSDSLKSNGLKMRINPQCKLRQDGTYFHLVQLTDRQNEKLLDAHTKHHTL